MKLYKTIYKQVIYKEGLLHDESIKHTDTSNFNDLKMMWTRYNDTTAYDERIEVIKMADIMIHEENESELNEFINNIEVITLWSITL